MLKNSKKIKQKQLIKQIQTGISGIQNKKSLTKSLKWRGIPSPNKFNHSLQAIENHFKSKQSIQNDQHHHCSEKIKQTINDQSTDDEDQSLHSRKKQLPLPLPKRYSEFTVSYKINCQMLEYENRVRRKNRRIPLEQLYIRTGDNERLMLLYSQYESKYFKHLDLSAEELKSMAHSFKPLCMSYGKYTPEQIVYALTPDHKIKDDHRLPIPSLYLAWTRTPDILDIVVKNTYSKLKVLNIGGSHITSVEILTQLDAPELSEIWAWNNDITEIRSLRKCNFRNMKVLDMNTNKIIGNSEMRQLCSSRISRVNVDTNKCVNFDGFIVLLSGNPSGKLNVIQNECPKIMRLPQKRRRKPLISVKPATRTGVYC